MATQAEIGNSEVGLLRTFLAVVDQGSIGKAAVSVDMTQPAVSSRCFGKTAPGFSGAGVWFPLVQPEGSTVWRPNLGLAGIQSSWYPRKEITLAVRVDQLVRFLTEKA